MQPGDVWTPAEAIVEGLVTASKKRAPAKRAPKVAASLEMTVVAAVKRDIAELAKRDEALATSGLAALALALAAEMDAKNPASSKSMCAARLKETLDGLRELAPPPKESDAIDDISAQREKRRATAGRAATADMPRS